MNSDIRDWNYRHYVANSLMMIPQNKHYVQTLYEWMNPELIDDRSPEQVTHDVCEKGGIILKD